jgi:glyoxylate reductase
MARVFVTRAIPPAAADLLRASAEVAVWPEDRPIPRELLLREIAGIDGLVSMITERIDDELLAAAGPRLKVVANVAVGYDNFDLAALTRHGVVGTNTPGVLDETTADFAFALMMAIARQVPASADYVKAGRWTAWNPNIFVGQDLHHTTLGIIGLGRIGRELAKRARGFDMRLLYHNRRRLPPAAERELGVEYRALDGLLAEADYVSLHVDLNETTRQLIDAARLAQMQPTAYLINAARGPLVDTEALYQALKQGTIAGAALDVTDPEPIPADHPLLGLPNCLVCPHIGSATGRTRLNMARAAVENVLAVLAGHRPPAPVNPAVLE